MEKQIKLLKSLYTKEAILYTINLYLDNIEYTIDEDDKYYIFTSEKIQDDLFEIFRQEINFNNLRFEIANNNKELRKIIISKALGSVNID